MGYVYNVMIISDFAQNKLLSAVHSGALETPAWSGFLRILCEQTHADYTAIMLRRGRGEIRISQINSHTENIWQRQISDFHRDELINYASLRHERVYALSEFASTGEHEKMPSHADTAIPTIYRHARFVHVAVGSGGYQAWIVIGRERRDFAAGDAAQLSALVPHFTMALETFAAIERERVAMQISNRASEQLNFGWMTLDDQGAIIDADDLAEKLLNDGKGIARSAQEKLLLHSRGAQDIFAAQLDSIKRGKRPAPKSIHLGDDPWLDILLTPPKKAAGDKGNIALIGYIHGDLQHSDARVEQISQLFGLTPAEAKLALALSRGRSIAESAEDQGISIHTARLYSKRIYAKTDTSGQADLVRLILSSVMALT